MFDKKTDQFSDIFNVVEESVFTFWTWFSDIMTCVYFMSQSSVYLTLVGSVYVAHD